MQLIDGKALADKIKDDIAKAVAERKANGKKTPHLAAILVGSDPASETYVSSKVKNCTRVGFNSTLIELPEDTTQEQLLYEIEDLNKNPEIDGFIVQLPLPKQIDAQQVLLAIDSKKDVDGFHPTNIGKMTLELPTLLPATPYGILKMIENYNINTDGKQILVIGRSNIVGRPMSILLSQKRPQGNATVTLAHSRTKNLETLTKQADIIVAAVGIPEILTGDMVKEGVVIIDVGIHRIKDDTKKRGYRLTGDVHFESVAPKSSFITPVPGGVGAMTIAMLLKNTLEAADL